MSLCLLILHAGLELSPLNSCYKLTLADVLLYYGLHRYMVSWYYVELGQCTNGGVYFLRTVSYRLD